MISFHPKSSPSHISQHFSAGFVTYDTNAPHDVARVVAGHAWSGIVWNGGRRLAENFAFSDWAVLDIDDEMHTYPLEQALEDYADSIHVIGTTRNHRLEKNAGVCDRFRIALPWAQRITDRAIYEGNMRRLRRKNDAIDGSTLSGAQHFFPCAHIVSVQTEGYCEPVTADRYETEPLPLGEYEAAVRAKRIDFLVLQKLPGWVKSYLEIGVAQPGERHRRGLGVAVELIELGMSPEDVVQQILIAPISRKWGLGEVRGLVRWAVQHVEGNLRSGETEQNEAGAEGSDLQRTGEHRQRGEPDGASISGAVLCDEHVPWSV